MKNIFKYLFIIIFLFHTPKIDALTGIVNVSDGLNLRSNYDVNNSRIIDLLKYNSKVDILEDKLYKGNGCDKGWYRVKYKNNTGYVCSSYINVINNNDYFTGDFKAKVNTSSYISVRNKPNSHSTLLDKLITGTSVVINSESKGPGCDSVWYNIVYHNNKTGYVCGDYINTKEELILKEEDYKEGEKEIHDELVKKGFPNNYIPYLMRMKREHKDWNFVPVNNNIDWNTFVSNEEFSNKIEGSTTSVLDYYKVPNMNGTEGGNWYYTNNAVNAFFMDPRNFLSDNFIFMFEGLSFHDKYHTKEVIKNIFNNTYLSNDEYVTYFVDAAKLYNVSPIHLASRVYKEGGTNESYGPVSGLYDKPINGCNVKGYYNYYNIGAYNNWEDGLYFATGTDCSGNKNNSFGRPWKTRKDAIYGGAEFISKSYIKEGQDTLYFQKFNTSSKPYFTHQYMTNIMAPTQEAERIYETMKDMKLVDSAFVFKIPVYNNMPDTVSLPNIADGDASVRNILINGKVLENFDGDVLEYVYYVKDNANNILLDVKPSKSSTKVKYDKNIKLDSKETIVKIVSTAENGNSKEYIIKVIKSLSVTSINDILSKLSVKVNNNYMKNIDVNTSIISLVSSIKKADSNALVIIRDLNGNEVSNNGKLKTGQKLELTSSNGEKKVFSIVVKGDNNGDGEITIFDLLKVQKHLLGSSKLSNAFLEASDTNDDGKVTILDLLRVQKHLLNGMKL